jgi:hypothetical protein
MRPPKMGPMRRPTPEKASIIPIVLSLSSLKCVAMIAKDAVELMPAPIPHRNFHRKLKKTKVVVSSSLTKYREPRPRIEIIYKKN